MSESTSREERRALRRVAGPEVLSVMKDTHQAIDVVRAGLNAQEQVCKERSSTVLRIVNRVEGQQEAFQRRRFWARIRWIFFGR